MGFFKSAVEQAIEMRDDEDKVSYLIIYDENSTRGDMDPIVIFNSYRLKTKCDIFYLKIYLLFRLILSCKSGLILFLTQSNVLNFLITCVLFFLYTELHIK